MKNLIIIVLLVISTTVFAAAQDTVQISKEAAIKALEDSDKVVALEAENQTLKKAVDDLKTEVYKIQIEFAKVSGEKTILETKAIRDDAILEQYRQYFFQKSRKKCFVAVLCVQ